MGDEIGTPYEGEEQKSNKTAVIIITLVALLCLGGLLCLGAIWLLWTYGDYWFGIVSLAASMLV